MRSGHVTCDEGPRGGQFRSGRVGSGQAGSGRVGSGEVSGQVVSEEPAEFSGQWK